MSAINRLGFVIVVFICAVHFSEQSFLRDILERGKAFLASKRYQSASDRIISHLHEEEQSDNEVDDEGGYEKPTHRETDYNAYEAPNTQNQNHLHMHSPASATHSHNKPSKHENQFDHKYVVYTKYPSSLNLYSVLGGLSFASLLATTLILLSRRNGSLFRTFDDDDLYRRNYLHGYFENDKPYSLFKLIDHSKKHWRKKWITT